MAAHQVFWDDYHGSAGRAVRRPSTCVSNTCTTLTITLSKMGFDLGSGTAVPRVTGLLAADEFTTGATVRVRNRRENNLLARDATRSTLGCDRCRGLEFRPRRLAARSGRMRESFAVGDDDLA